jgi:hypothetical protein
MYYLKEQLHNMNRTIFKIALGRITQYANALGYTVNVNSNTYAIYKDAYTITAPRKAYNTQACIIGLLHELGHAIQSESTFTSLPRTRVNDSALVLELEYTAWREGWSIARELHIDTSILEYSYKAAWSRFWIGYAFKLAEYPRSTLKTLVSGYEP